MSIANHLTPNDLKLVPQAGLTPEQQAAFDKAYGEENERLRAARYSREGMTKWNYQRFAKDYLRCVDAVDDNVGRVLDYLDESGLAESTVVIYTSDQGWYLGEHGWYDKRWMYEESFRTPLLIRWPGKVKAGSVSEEMVMNLDLAETFLDIAGLAVPADMQGRSIVPILAGNPPADWRTSVYYHYYEFPQPHHVHPHRGVRTERYKLIHFYTIDEWELFDLEKDPREMKSAYADPTYATVVADMKKELTRLMEHYKDDGTSVVQFPRDPAQPLPKAKKKK
jgi:arylsulfatase A-like enzyme